MISKRSRHISFQRAASKVIWTKPKNERYFHHSTGEFEKVQHKKLKLYSAKRRWQRKNNNKNPAEEADEKRTRRRDRVEIRIPDLIAHAIVLLI